METHMQGPQQIWGHRPTPHTSDGETHETMPESSRAHHMHSSGLAQACLVCLVSAPACAVKSRSRKLWGLSLSLSLSLCCDQGWVSKFSLCQGSFSYQLQQETRVYFLPDLVYIFPKNYIKQRLTLSILSVDDYIYPEKILLTSKFFFVFCFIFFGGETPPIHLTETGTANSWETTNSKPPGPIIMITN